MAAGATTRSSGHKDHSAVPAAAASPHKVKKSLMEATQSQQCYEVAGATIPSSRNKVDPSPFPATEDDSAVPATEDASAIPAMVVPATEDPSTDRATEDSSIVPVTGNSPPKIKKSLLDRIKESPSTKGPGPEVFVTENTSVEESRAFINKKMEEISQECGNNKKKIYLPVTEKGLFLFSEIGPDWLDIRRVFLADCEDQSDMPILARTVENAPAGPARNDVMRELRKCTIWDVSTWKGGWHDPKPGMLMTFKHVNGHQFFMQDQVQFNVNARNLTFE
jgi:hypothetical protein